MPIMSDFAFGKAAGLTTAFVATVLSSHSDQPDAVPVQKACSLDSVRMRFTVTAGSPTKVTWLLSEDAAGNYPVNIEQTSDLSDTQSATVKCFHQPQGYDHKQTAAAVQGRLYLHWKLDAGTADAEAFLFSRTA